MHAYYDYNEDVCSNGKKKSSKNAEKNGDSDMLETSEERVKLLKAGISARNIEQLYLINNNFKTVNIPVLFEAIEVRQETEGKVFLCELTAKFANA